MHPALYFIRYLMTLGDRALADDNGAIRGVLTQLGLFEKLATDPVLEDIRKDIEIPADYRPGALTHRKTLEFQKKLRVRDMHSMTVACKKANELRESPAHREFVEQLLLSYTPFAETARRTNEKFRSRYKKEEVAAFYHYFFNVEAIPRAKWVDAIKARRSIPYKSAMAGDNRLVLWRHGEKIAVDAHEALEAAFTQAFVRMEELRTMPTNMATIGMFQRGVDSMVRLQQAMSESEVRMKEVLKQLEQFKQSRRQVEIPDISALGEHAEADAMDNRLALPDPGAKGLN